MKFAWVFLIITMTNPDKPQVLVSVRFKTEQECRAYEVQHLPPPNIAVGCLPLGVQQ